jgi:hypothetical protein
MKKHNHSTQEWNSDELVSNESEIDETQTQTQTQTQKFKKKLPKNDENSEIQEIDKIVGKKGNK